MARDQKSFAARQAALKKMVADENLSNMTVSLAKAPAASHPSLVALVRLLARQAAREAAREAVAASQTTPHNDCSK